MSFHTESQVPSANLILKKASFQEPENVVLDPSEFEISTEQFPSTTEVHSVTYQTGPGRNLCIGNFCITRNALDDVVLNIQGLGWKILHQTELFILYCNMRDRDALKVVYLNVWVHNGKMRFGVSEELKVTTGMFAEMPIIDKRFRLRSCDHEKAQRISITVIEPSGLEIRFKPDQLKEAISWLDEVPDCTYSYKLDPDEIAPIVE